MKTITKQLSLMKLLRKAIGIISIVGFSSVLSAQQGATLDFDGVDDEVNCGTSTTLDLSGNFTIEAWIYPTAKSTISSIVSKRLGGNGQPGYQLGINGWNTSDGTIWFETSSSTNVHTSTSVTLNTWQHVAVVVTGTTAAIYLNGIAQPLVTNDVSISASTEPFLIGGFHNGYNFAGSIDELRIWNYAQCQGEIQTNMNGEIPTTATGLIANYHFNQGIANGSNPTETSLNEYSGNNFSGTLMNFALSGSTSNWISPGAFTSGNPITPSGATLNFDGIDDEVNCGTSTTFDLSGNFTIEAWIYPTAKSTISSIVSKRMGGNGQPGYQLGINSWNTSDGTIWFESSSSTNVQTSTSVTLDTWQHVAVVVTGTTAAIYLNGIAQPLVNNDVLLSASTEPLLIGGFHSGYNFAGSIDELRIWDYAQCQGEIQNNMNGEIPTTATGLIANYHFNQGNAAGINNCSAITLTDYSGNNFNGTFSNFTLTGPTSNFIAPGGVVSGIAVTPFVPASSSQTVSACGSYTIGSNTYTASGTYTDAFALSNGCDSTVTTYLTINNIPTVTASASSITVCLDDADVALTGAPAGGIWSGPGITGSNFDPSSGSGAQTLTYNYTDANNCSSSATVVVTVNACVGVTENSLTNGFNIIPNPNNGTFTLLLNTTSIAEVSIFDALGQLVSTQKAQPNSQMQMNIAETGMYMIRVITSDGHQTIQRVIVNH